MDLSHAVWLVAVIIGLVEVIKNTFPNLPEQARPAVSLAIGVGAAFLTAHSIWANETVVGDKALGDMGWASLVMVGIVAGGVANATYWAGRRVVANIGENQDGA